MDHNARTFPVSQFEEVDPGRDRAGRAHRPELVLAALLLGGILSFAGAEWLGQAMRARAYQTGVAAVAVRHWAVAQDAFARAGAYETAPAQQQHAAAQVRALVTQYAALQTAAAAGDWLQAWHLAHAVAAIQPDYRDVAAQVSAADAALFGVGTGSIVYLEVHGPQPGLYLRTTDGTITLLPGTDGSSHIAAIAPQGERFLYDVVPAPQDTANGVCQTSVADRLLADPAPRLALTTAGASPTTILLPTAFDPQGSAWFTSAGFWGTAPNGRLLHYDFARQAVTGGFALAPDASVLAAIAPREALLLGATVRDSEDVPRTLLTLITPDGRSAPVAAVPGFLLAANASPDGRYATVLAEEAGAAIARTLYLIDLSAPGRPPQILDRIAWEGIQMAAQLRAAFVPGRPTTQVIVTHKDDAGAAVWNVSLPDGARSRIWSSSDSVQRDEQAGLSADGQAFAFRSQFGGQSALVWLPIERQTAPTSLPIDTLGGQFIDTWFTPHSDYLLYRVRNPDGLDQGTSQDVFTLPTPPVPGAAPRLLAETERVYDPSLPTLALPAGGAVAVFVAPDGVLHARTLDGAADTPLAPDGAAVWALMP